MASNTRRLYRFHIMPYDRASPLSRCITGKWVNRANGLLANLCHHSLLDLLVLGVGNLVMRIAAMQID